MEWSAEVLVLFPSSPFTHTPRNARGGGGGGNVNFRPLALNESLTQQFHFMLFGWDNLDFQECSSGRFKIHYYVTMED